MLPLLPLEKDMVRDEVKWMAGRKKQSLLAYFSSNEVDLFSRVTGVTRVRPYRYINKVDGL